MEESANEKIKKIVAPMIYFVSVLGVVIHGQLQKKELSDVLSIAVLSVVLAGVFWIVLKAGKWDLWNRLSNPVLFLGSLCLTWGILVAQNVCFLGSLCFLVLVVAVLDAGIEMGIVVYGYVMIQKMILQLPLQSLAYKEFVPVVFGLLIMILFSMIKDRKVMPYVTIILFACDGVLQIVQYEFQINKMVENYGSAMMEFGSVLLLCLIAYAYLRIAPGKEEIPGQDTETIQMSNTASVSETEQAEEEAAVTQEEDIWDTILKPDFELCKRLQQYSPLLMSHSLKISLLSEGAAMAVGGDGMLAKAAGLYHEVGRIEKGADYIDVGTNLAREYQFPESLIAVMRQHSTGHELPKSIEAAVVMLSDCIISTSDYLEKTGKRALISDEKLIESIFENRIQKGNLKESGITEEQIVRIKEYYKKNAFADAENKEVSKGDTQ